MGITIIPKNLVMWKSVSYTYSALIIILVSLFPATSSDSYIPLSNPAQSSSHQGGGPEKAIDKDIKSMSHTKTGRWQWFYVQIPRIYLVTQVTVINRLSCCHNR